jgi:cold shock CspA family protein
MATFSATPPDPSKRREINVEDIEIGVPKQKPVDPQTVSVRTVSFFNNDKGYGFIKDHKSQESIFVHVNSCSEPIQERSKVSFEVEMDLREQML